MKKKLLVIIIILIMLPLSVHANELINTHTTQSYTKEEVLERYKKSLPSFDYSQSYYNMNSEPIFIPSYFQGVLKDGIVEDYLKSLNYYRYLAGLNPLTINKDRMYRAQRTAFVQYNLETLTSSPNNNQKPVGMSNYFWEEATYGSHGSSNFDDAFSSSLSKEKPEVHQPYTLVKFNVENLINQDTYFNAKLNNRYNILNPSGISTSFGFMNNDSDKIIRRDTYGVVTVHYDGRNINTNKDEFYPWPPAGYIPAESFNGTYETLWSVWIGKYEPQESTKITIGVHGKDYVLNNGNIVHNYLYNYIFWKLPINLYEEIIRENGQYITDTPIKIKIENLMSSDDNEQFRDLEYTTTFIQAQSLPIENIYLSYSKNANSPKEKMPSNLTINRGEKLYYQIEVEPSGANSHNVEIKSTDESILKIDKTNKVITALKSGNVKLIINDNKANIQNDINIRIDSPATGIKLDSTKVIKVGKTISLKASLVPDDTTTIANFNWSSSNPDIASIDQLGNITAHKVGTTIITVTSNGFSSKCIVTVDDFLLGDVTEDGNVDLTDVMYALRISLNLVQNVPNEVVSIGDINSSGNIDLSDVMHILRISLNLV